MRLILVFIVRTSASRALGVPCDEPELADLLVRAGERLRAVVVDDFDPEPSSAAARPFVSNAMTTRSGRYAAIASTFGVKPESAVFGAAFG